MATLANVLSFSRAQAQTDSNGLTDANGIIFANEALVDFHRRLADASVDASQLQESYENGVIPATDGNGSTSLYPTDMLRLKSIAVNFSDTTGQNYITAEQVDVANLPSGQSFMWLRKNASVTKPMFDDRGDWYEIFPSFSSATNVTNAVRIFYYLKPTEYTSTSDTLAYPESQDYRILGWRICASYLYSLGKVDEGDMFNNKYEERVRQYISTLSRGAQQPLQANSVNISGWEF